MLNPSLIRAIQSSQHRDRIIYFVLAGCSVLFGFSFFAAFISGGADFPSDKRPNLLWIGGVFCLMGLYLLLYVFKLQVNVVKLLERSPHQIVWVYLRVNQGSSYAAAIQFQFVMFGLRNRKQIGVRLSAEACDALMQEMPRIAPHATLGYTPEFNAEFKRDPTLLIRG